MSEDFDEIFEIRAYPATLIPDDGGGFTVTLRDVPEAITESDTRDDALLRAEDALESALAMYIAAHEPLPVPSPPLSDEVMVLLSTLGMAKAALYEAMREQGVGRAELARRLRWHLAQVNRVLDPRHASRMEQVEAALAALGLRLFVDVTKAAYDSDLN
jgi:antitoxin HicB